MRRAYASIARPPYLEPDGAVDQLVVGAGVVGLAIGRALSRLHDRSTFVIERNQRAGQETSARNSGVIHSGIHYPAESLKTRLCIRGRQLLYSHLDARGIPHRKTAKLTVATSQAQHEYLDRLVAHCRSVGVPAELISGDGAREMEPDLSESTSAAVLTPETGIVDVHSLMESFEADIVGTGQADLVYGTRVLRIDRLEARAGKGRRGDGSDEGWVVQTQTDDGPPSSVLAKVVVNAAGLSARHLVNQILPEPDRRPLHICRGSYFAYKGPGVGSVQRLLYPCPQPQFSGLGTHLTVDLAGSVRFGPDVQWLQPTDDERDDPDWWQRHLQVNEERLDSFYEAVHDYLPNVSRDGFTPDYVGFRPKLNAEGEPASDFGIGVVAPGFVNVEGIESPGLTSCLAIAEHVEKLVRREIGLGVGTGRTISATGSEMDARAWA